MADGKAAVTFEDIKSKTTFEDTDLEVIAREAAQEVDNEHKAKDGAGDDERKEPKKEDGAPKEGAEEGELSPEEKAAKESEDKQKEEERILAAKDDELKPEEKTRKAELLKVKEESDKKAQDEEVKVIAKEYGITEDEARASFEHVAKLREKYKDNPKELAKANYFQQRFLSKQTEELKALKASPPSPQVEPTIENVIKILDDGKMKSPKGEVITREMVVEAYRKEYADITETVDDDTVLKMAAKEYIKTHEARVKEAHAKMSTDAAAKRAELLKAVPEEFLTDIKPIIENSPDRAILQPEFSLDDTIAWAKGKRFDAAVKEAEERGYKRGQESAKILGEKKGPEGGKPPAKKSRTLSEADKKRALDMFDGQDIPDEKKFEMFLEIESDTKSKKKE